MTYATRHLERQPGPQPPQVPTRVWVTQGVGAELRLEQVATLHLGFLRSCQECAHAHGFRSYGTLP